jgi:hypothetical protein
MRAGLTIQLWELEDFMKLESNGLGPAKTTLGTREVYRNPWLRVREDEILRSSGKEGIHGVVDKDDCAIILPIENDRIWLVEQFRYTIQERALKLPQGGWQMQVENPEELARNELKEELGLEAREMDVPRYALDRVRLCQPKAACFSGDRLDTNGKGP